MLAAPTAPCQRQGCGIEHCVLGTARVCVCTCVYTHVLGVPSPLVLSCLLPDTCGSADTMLHPGDPPGQEAQLKPRLDSRPKSCRRVNAWSLKSRACCSTVARITCVLRAGSEPRAGTEWPPRESPLGGSAAGCLLVVPLVQLHGYRGAGS